MSKMTLKKARRRIADTMPGEALQRETDAIVEATRAELASRREACRDLNRKIDLLPNHPGRNPRTNGLSRGLGILALILIPIDAVWQGSVNAAAFPELSENLLWILAPVIALLLTSVVHYFALLIAYNADKPTLSIRILLQTGIAVFIVSAVAFTVVMFARMAPITWMTWLIPAVAISSFVLAESLPISIGCWTAARSILDETGRLERRLTRETRRVVELEGIIDSILERPRLQLSQPSSRHAAVVTSTAVFLTLATASQLAAQPPAPCGLFVDRTASVDQQHRQRAVDFFVTSLDSLLATYQCREIMIGDFAGEGEWSSRESLSVMPPPQPDTVCDSLPTATRRGAIAHLAGVREFDKRDAARACDAAMTNALVQYRLLRDSIADRVRQLGHSTPNDPAATTEISTLLGSLLNDEYILLMFITDGLETGGSLLRRPSLPDNMDIVFINVPAAPNYGGPAATRRALQEWAANIPHLKLAAYPDLASKGFWRRTYLSTRGGAQ